MDLPFEKSDKQYQVHEYSFYLSFSLFDTSALYTHTADTFTQFSILLHCNVLLLLTPEGGAVELGYTGFHQTKTKRTSRGCSFPLTHAHPHMQTFSLTHTHPHTQTPPPTHTDIFLYRIHKKVCLILFFFVVHLSEDKPANLYFRNQKPLLL